MYNEVSVHPNRFYNPYRIEKRETNQKQQIARLLNCCVKAKRFTMSINNSRAPFPLPLPLVTIVLFTMNGVWTEWGGERGGKGISGSSICFALLSLWIYFCTIYFDFCIKRNIVCVCVTHTHWCSICVPVCVCPRVCVPAFPLPSVSLFINDKRSSSATKLLLLLLLLRQNVLRMFARLPIRSLPL